MSNKTMQNSSSGAHGGMPKSSGGSGFFRWLAARWQENPVYSTGAVLIVMVIIQTFALGFDYPSFADWFSGWGRNWINILRNNASVGIVALGMAFVIISGGIDLAVGSTWSRSARS